jgi:glycosyltransferase involved in cell wall biosynthesis
VDDASTDRTVKFRKISATRNAGAREASGELLFFVDADTVVPPRALEAALRALRHGAIGGGAAVRFDGPVPLYARILERVVLPLLLPLLKMAPGCFLFCTRQAYVGAGGFDESRSWAEEVIFSNRLKMQGRFVMLREYVITSGRKVRTHSALDMLRVGFRLARGQPAGLDFWYGPQRKRTPNA